MSQQKEIEEAIKYFEGDLRELQVTEIHQKPLVNLAQRYLEIDGFPEEKEQSDLSSNPHICFENAGYNQAIQDCKLALLKKMDGIEDVVCNACNDCIDKTGGCAMLSNIFKAIKSHLTK